MRHRREEGFSLVEVLVAISLVGLIGGAVVTTFILGSQAADDGLGSLIQSGAAQTVSRFFVPDVQSADQIKFDDTSCTDPANPGDTPVLWLSRTETVGVATSVYSTAYVTRTDAGTTQLVRLECAGATPALTSWRVLVPELDDVTAPAVTCDPAADCTGPSPYEPASLTLTVKTTSRDRTSRTFTITATRRSEP